MIEPSYFVLDRRRNVTALVLGRAFPLGIHDWSEAEKLGLVLMRLLGFDDAEKTAAGADRGIDVLATRGACQVKHWTKKVGRADLQRLSGASFGRVAVFLARSYSPHALAWGDEAGIALFQYDETGVVHPLNAQAKALANAAPRMDPLRASGASTELRFIRIQQWLSFLRIGIRVATPEEEKRFRRGMQNVERRLQNLANGAATRRGTERRMRALESAVRKFAADFGVELPT